MTEAPKKAAIDQKGLKYITLLSILFVLGGIGLFLFTGMLQYADLLDYEEIRGEQGFGTAMVLLDVGAILMVLSGVGQFFLVRRVWLLSVVLSLPWALLFPVGTLFTLFSLAVLFRYRGQFGRHRILL